MENDSDLLGFSRDQSEETGIYMGGRLDDKERNYDSSSYESRSDQETGQSLGRRKPRRSLFVDAMRPRAKVRVSIGSTDQDIHFCSFELQGHSIS